MIHCLEYRKNFGVFAVSLLLLCPVVLSAAEVKQSLDVVAETNRSAAASQKKIDSLSIETRSLLDEYIRLQDGNAYQEAYTTELQELDKAQQQQLDELKAQISQARITRQRIVPLMRSMADALEKFVVLDLPFHHEDRINAVLQLKQRLNEPELSVSARFRLLLEAYQLEQDYGSKIEAWRGPLELQGETLSVEYLRVGRTALYFQGLDGGASGYWDRARGEWKLLDSEYNRAIAQALRVAKNLSAPELLQLPLMPPGDAS